MGSKGFTVRRSPGGPGSTGVLAQNSRLENLPAAGSSCQGRPVHARPGGADHACDLGVEIETARVDAERVVRAAEGSHVALAIPPGYEAQVRPRSGLALKHGLTLPNTPATIDSDYRGELMVALINLGTEPVTVTRGMRIAQLVFQKVEEVELREVAELPVSERGGGGFGSTGA